MITIYGIPASRASRSLWMLEELGLDYENVPTHFLGETQKPEFLAVNPNGRIPALDDDGLVLFESLAINLHLARKYGADKGLWPKDPDDQSRAIQWSIWAMTEVEPPVMKALMNRGFLPEAQRDAAVGDQGERELQKPVKVLEGALGDREHLLGGDFTVADLNVASVLSWAPTMGKCDLSAYPKVSAWLARCNRPALQRVFAKR